MNLWEAIIQSDFLSEFILSLLGLVLGWLGIKARETLTKINHRVDAERNELEMRTSKEQVQLMEQIARIAVRYAQQRFSDSGNDVKLQKAIESAQNQIQEKNIVIGGVELEDYIESAYNALKDGFKGETTKVEIDVEK